MPCGSRGQNGAITISAAKKAHLIEAMVQDTGFGMSAVHLPHLFERFYKLTDPGGMAAPVCAWQSYSRLLKLMAVRYWQSARKVKAKHLLHPPQAAVKSSLCSSLGELPIDATS